MSWGAPGPGRHITIYASPGHVYMVVNGRRYDTTGRNETGIALAAAPSARRRATWSATRRASKPDDCAARRAGDGLDTSRL